MFRGYVVDDKGGKFISKEFQNYCLETGVSPKYASTNTPQQTSMSERVGRTLAVMVRYMFADTELPNMMWEELMFTAAFLGNKAPHSAIGISLRTKYHTGRSRV